MLACLHRQRLELAGRVRARQIVSVRCSIGARLPLLLATPEEEEDGARARRRPMQQRPAHSATTASAASARPGSSPELLDGRGGAPAAATADANARALTRRISRSRDWREAARAYDRASARGETNAIHLAAAAWLAAWAAGQTGGGGGGAAAATAGRQQQRQGTSSASSSAAAASDWLLGALRRDLAHVLPDCEPRQLATLLWSLSAAAAARTQAGSPLPRDSPAEALAAAMAAAAGRAAARDLVGAAWALASLSAAASVDAEAAAVRLMPALWARTAALPPLSPQELATLLRAAANLSASSTSASAAAESSSGTADASNLLLPPPEWLERAWRASSAPGWWSEGSSPSSPSPSSSSSSRPPSASLLAGALWGAVRLGGGGSAAAAPPPPRAWVAGVVEALARAAPRTTASEAASAVGALRMLSAASQSLPREAARAWLRALSGAWGGRGGEEEGGLLASSSLSALATLARELAALGMAAEVDQAEGDDDDMSALLARLQRQVQFAAAAAERATAALSPAQAAALARAARAASPPSPLPWAPRFLERALLLRREGDDMELSTAAAASDLALVASVAAAAAEAEAEAEAGASSSSSSPSSLPAAGPAAVAAVLLRRARHADDPAGSCAPAVLVAVCRLRDAANSLQEEEGQGGGALLLLPAEAAADLSAVAAAALAALAAPAAAPSPPRASCVSAAACVHAAASLGCFAADEATADAALDAALRGADEREVGVALRSAALWATAAAAAAASAAAGGSASSLPSLTNNARPSPAWWSRVRTEAVARLLRRAQLRGGRAAAARAAVRLLAALTPPPALSSSPPLLAPGGDASAPPCPPPAPSPAAPMQLELRRDLWRGALLHRHEAGPRQAAELLLLAGRAAGGRLRPPSARWLEAALRPVVVVVPVVDSATADALPPSPEQWLQLLRVLARWRCPASPERDAAVAAAASALAPAGALGGAERAARALRAASRLPEPFPPLDAAWVDAVVDAVSEAEGQGDEHAQVARPPLSLASRSTCGRGQRRPAPPAAVVALALGRLLLPRPPASAAAASAYEYPSSSAFSSSSSPSSPATILALAPDRARRLLAAVARALPRVERPSLAVAVLHSSAAVAARCSSSGGADRAAAPVAEAFLDLCAEMGAGAFGAAMGGVPGFAKAAWALAKAGAVVMDDAMLREVMDAACWGDGGGGGGDVDGGEEGEEEVEAAEARPTAAAASSSSSPAAAPRRLPPPPQPAAARKDLSSSPWTPQRLANTLCAFTRLGFNPGADRLARLGTEARESGALGGNGGGNGNGNGESPMAALDQEVIVAAWAELNASYRPLPSSSSSAG